MLIETAVFGPIEVEEDNIFHMPDGLYGFDESNDYALITKQEEDVTLMWFQAVDATVPCFVVFNPVEVIDGYDPLVENTDLRALDCKDSADLEFLVIAVVPDDLTHITVNLKSPVALNRKNKKARQVILSNKEYPIKFPLFAPEDEN